MHLRRLSRALSLLALAAWLPCAADPSPAGWQACAGLAEASARLACFDRWAATQSAPAARPAPPPAARTAATPAPPLQALPPTPAAAAAPVGLRLTSRSGCRDPRVSELSRYWELEPGADCGSFGIRGYRPISIGVVAADSVNRQPTSGNPANNATTATDYRDTELRLQLSVRTKLAQRLLVASPEASDSLWFAYSQQSYWQLFTPELSRPFRSTDHEPELVYVAPLQSALPGRWRLRYGGLGVVHHSNGQSLPLSRSWNRAYLMLGAEHGRLQLHGRVWKRIPEGGPDDNPAIGDYLGRAELQAVWHADRDNLWALTVRHALQRQARGSWRLAWFRSLDQDGTGRPGGLQLHSQLFTGYGDTLLDFNRRRTVLSIGLSLVDW